VEPPLRRRDVGGSLHHRPPFERRPFTKIGYVFAAAGTIPIAGVTMDLN